MAEEGVVSQILDQLDEYAIFTMDEDRCVTRVFAGVPAILGFTHDEFVRRSGDVVFTEEDRKSGAPEQEQERAKRLGKTVDERWHQKQDGSRFWGSGFLFRLTGADGGYVKIIRDVTGRKRMEE